MKNNYQSKLVLTLMSFLVPFLALAQQPFITIWDTSNGDITIPAYGEYTYYWENLNDTSMNGQGAAADEKTISFPAGGIYEVQISPVGENPFHRIEINQYEDKEKLLSIEQWGDVNWSSLEKAFYGAANMKINAKDIPNLNNVTDMSYAFAGTQIGTVPNINNWDVSHVTNMFASFFGASEFNSPIGNWDVSHVTDMSHMFQEAASFNQNIGDWDVSALENMDYMFAQAESFDSPIGSWNISNVTSLEGVFWEALNFNQPLNDWDVSNVTSLMATFSIATSFDQPLNNWDTSNVNTLFSTFAGAIIFNQPLNNWDVSKVTNMQSMFESAKAFNQSIENWNVGNVTNMRNVFTLAVEFNQPLNDWDVSKVKYASEMFALAYAFDQLLDKWTLKSLLDADMMFHNSEMSCENYSLLLHGWANNPETAKYISFGATPLEYSPDVKEDRDYLINELGWNILGDMEGTCEVLSVKDFDMTSVQIYPNPASDFITISNLQGKETLEIFDLKGQLMKTFYGNAEDATINIAHLASGVYFVKITNQKGNSTNKKFVKK